MSFEQRKLMILAAWIATVATIGIVATIEDPSMWVFVGSAAVIPAAIANWLWHAPEVTMAELIAKYRR